MVVRIKSEVSKSGVSAIGAYAFYGLEELQTVTFEGTTLETLGDFSFACYSEELTSFEFPSSVKDLGRWALSLPGITTLAIPTSLKTIEECALTNCTGLTAFTVAKDNTAFTVDNGALFGTVDGSKTLIAYPIANNATSYSIPEGTTVIGAYAFNGAGNLTTITIPSTVTTLQTKAFQNTGLTSISIPNTVTTIGTEILRNCKSLEYLYYDSMASLTGNTILENAGANAENGLTVVFGDSVTTIPANFAYSSNVSNNPRITAVSWKDGTSVGEKAFYKCTALKVILVRAVSETSAPTSTIGNNAFTDVTATVFASRDISDLSLTQKIYPVNEEKAIEAGSTTSIDDFDDLGLLGTLSYTLASGGSDFTVSGNVVSLSTDPTSESATINVSLAVNGINGSVSLGSITLKYAGEKKTVTGTSGAWGYSYEYYSNVPSDGVLSLTSYTGSDTTVKLPETLSITVGETSYNDISVSGVASNFSATSVKTVVIPATIKTIADAAFSSSSLEQVFFLPGSSCDSVGKTAFGAARVYCDAALADALGEQGNTFTICDVIADVSGNASLVIAYLTDGTLTLTGTGKMINISPYNGAPWYSMRNSISAAKVDDGITYIGSYFLNDCTNVKTFTIPSSVRSLALNALSSPSFDVVYINSSFSDSQGKYEYRYLANLKADTVVFGESVTSIPAYLLNDNKNVKKIIIKGSPTSIGSNICQSTGSVTHIYVVDGTTAQKITGPVANTNIVFVIGNGATVDEGTDKSEFSAVSKDGYIATWYEYDSSIAEYSGYSNKQPVTTVETGKTYIAVWATCNHRTKTYAAEGDKLTESCADCGHVFGTATVAAPAELTYDGSEKAATVTTTSGWTGAAPIPVYYSGDTKLKSIPTNAGDYTAKVTVQGATASVNFTITKAAPTIDITAEPASLVGGGAVKLTVTTDAPAEVVPTCEGVTVTKNTDGTFTAALPNETKTYTFKASYAGDDNHKEATDTCEVSVTRRSSSGGSSSSGSSYAVSTPSTKNGDVTVSPKNASKGDRVTVTVKPDSGYEIGSVTVLDSKGNELKLTDKGNGKYTFTMPGGKVEVKATFVKAGETSPFVDVPADSYYFDAVKWAQKLGITNGKTDVLFGSNDPCTRGQIVTFLWRAAGSPAPKGTAKVPADVLPGSYCYNAVAWAIENGITNGFADGTFGVNSTCTRGQSVTFLYRALGTAPTTVNGFTDVAAGDFYAEAVAWAVENGVTNGTTDSTFSPSNGCTRAQIVTFLYRAKN